jgi:nucleoid DNA-binding protein
MESSLYSFNEALRIHLRNRESVKLPFGFGEISINKKKKKKDIKG